MPPRGRLFIHSFAGSMAMAAVLPLANARVTMPSIFGDHMVLQQDTKLPIWGWADPGENIKVTLGDESLSTAAGPDGSWRVELPPRPRSANDTPQSLTVAGNDTRSFQDVLIGDVWVASGQSNMAFGMQRDSRGAEAMANANNPKIRLFHVAPATALAPQRGDSLQGEWVVCTPQSLKESGPSGFSAAAYYFAREIVQVTGNPIGLIGTYWGGTPAEAWTSLSGLQKEPRLKGYVDTHRKISEGFAAASEGYEQRKAAYEIASKEWYKGPGKEYNAQSSAWQEAAAKATAAGQPIPAKPKMSVPKPVPTTPPDGGQTAPTNLFNAMISPLIPYAIKGVIWYQGEANGGATKGPEYATLFARLITDWREKWGQGDFPFLFVQLAGYGAPARTPSEGSSPLVREGQLRALSLPATGMASAIDIGDPWDIHPTDKLNIGLRLALAARHVAYGQKLIFSGPLYTSMKIEGDKIRLAFNHVGGGLVMSVPPWPHSGKPPTELTGFGIAGADHKWVWAKAAIEGNTIVVSSDKVPEPVAVRYGWGNSPPCNLYNQEGLPASPFRTDDWD